MGGVMTRLRIGIDLHGLHDLMQGSRTYVGNLTRALLELDRDNEYQLYLPDPQSLEARQAFARPNARLRSVPASRFSRLIWPFPRTLPAHGLDVYHCQYIGPLFCPVPYVVTIHDILHETNPEFFPGSLRRLMRLLYPGSARRAAMVLTVSEYSKNEIVRHYGLPEERVLVSPNGVGPEFTPLLDQVFVRQALERHSVVPPYILFVGRIEPRKNLEGLIQAFEKLVAQGERRRLVVVGMMDELFRDFYERTVTEQARENIVFTGKVAHEDLPAFYKAADLLVYPSFAEGFGLPIVEAMACGTPVVTSTTTSMPEVAGDAALLVAPSDVEAMAQAIHDVLRHSALAERLKNKGFKRAARFRWETTARDTLAVYEQVAKR